MSDTIEWLENIGKNAALRRAPADELASALEQTDASEVLRAAAAAGDSSLLSTELGHKPMKVNHDVHTGGHEDDEDPRPAKDDPDRSPPRPDQEQPSKDH